MSDAINMDLQSSMLLETLRQTPSIQDNNHQDSGGGGSAGDGNAKSTSSSSLSSSADGGGGIGGINSDGTSDKNALEAMDPAIMSTSAPAGNDSPVSGIGSSEKNNRTRYSVDQLLALRNLKPCRKKPSFMVKPKTEKLARMFLSLDIGTDKYGKSLFSTGKTSDAQYEDENGGGNGSSSANYGRNRVANGSNSGNTDGPSSGGGNRMDMRRSGGMDLRDPKDRLRKEDGIVLSPQRRSFNMGCQMPAAPGANTSGLNIGGGLLRNERDLLGGRERRIGSGRILSRDVSWDYRPDKDAPESNDFRASGNANFGESRDNRSSRDNRENRDSRDGRDTRETRESRDPRDTRDRNDRDKDSRKEYDREERFERRPMNREYDRSDKDSRHSRMSSRYSNAYNSNNDSHGNNNYHSNNYNHYHSSHHDRRKMYSDHGRDEEPEWFSEPTSQTDTIELRGFDDTVSEEETKSEKDDSRDDPKHDLESKPAEKDGKRPSSSLQNDKNNNDDASDVLLLGRTGATNDKTNANPLLAPTSPNTVQMNRTPGDGASESSGKSALTTALGIPNTLGPSKITNDDDFNFEDFLALPSNLLYDPPSKDTGSSGGSRFSQWFKPDNAVQPPPAQQSGLNQTQQQPKQPAPQFVDSRRSSLQDEINNMINDFTSTGLDDQISDSNSNKYFAPISPAASTSSNSLLELFQRGEKQQQQQQQPMNRDREHHPQQQLQPQQQQQSAHPQGHPLLVHPPNHPGLHLQQQQQHHQQIQNRNLQQLLGVSGSGNIGNHGPHGPIPPAPSGGQIHSVEELEARFRQSDNDGNNRTPGTVPSIPRLITPSSATGGGGNSSGGVGTGHLSNDAQQQDMNAFKKLLAQISENQPHNAQPTPAAHPPHHQSLPINILHHQQQQNDLLQKMLHLNQMHHPINDGRQSEILKRPEAQALLHGVARGEVTQHNLWQQLTNPATAQPHREILTSVLSTINTSPRVVSPNILIQPSPGGVPILPPASVPTAAVAVAAAAANSANLLFQHHSKQQMRLSPLPNGMPQRIPSPRELQYHTQSIMQNALIRKKLEEQRENYRKRQEQQQQQQQNRNQPETSSTPSSSTSSTTTAATATGVSSSVPPSNIQQIGNQPTNTTANNAPITVPASSAVATPVVVSSFASPAKQTPPSHSHSQHTSSPTPLAFTPTSVLRKMTAEKEIEPLSSNNSTISTPSSSAMPNAQPSDRPPLGAAGHNQSILMGLNNPLTQQQQLQQRNLAALIGAHPPLQPPHSQPPGPPPQLPHHHLGAGHHPSTMGAPQPTQPPQTNPQQMRAAHQPPGMPGGNIPWNLKQPHPGPQMPPMSKPQGRPILKGGNTQPQPPQQQQHPSAMSQMSFASNLEFQQQMQQFQGRSGNPILGAHQSQQQQQQQQQQLLQQQQQQQQQQQPPPPPHNQHQSQMNPHIQQLLQQRQQQQQRAIRNQHMQQIPPSFRMGPQQPQQPQSQGQHSHQGQPQQQGASGIINYNRDGGLSPTSNQLARWFSPELLAQASAGKLPSLSVGQAMSLEEFERNMQHSSATVHN